MKPVGTSADESMVDDCRSTLADRRRRHGRHVPGPMTSGFGVSGSLPDSNDATTFRGRPFARRAGHPPAPAVGTGGRRQASANT